MLKNYKKIKKEETANRFLYKKNQNSFVKSNYLVCTVRFILVK